MDISKGDQMLMPFNLVLCAYNCFGLSKILKNDIQIC